MSEQRIDWYRNPEDQRLLYKWIVTPQIAELLQGFGWQSPKDEEADVSEAKSPYVVPDPATCRAIEDELRKYMVFDGRETVLTAMEREIAGYIVAVLGGLGWLSPRQAESLERGATTSALNYQQRLREAEAEIARLQAALQVECEWSVRLKDLLHRVFAFAVAVDPLLADEIKDVLSKHHND